MRLHVFDIDGTIAEDTLGLSEKMVDTLLKIKETDMVWFATGRGYLSAQKGLLENKNLMLDSRIAVENGGKVYFNDELITPPSKFTEKQVDLISYWIESNKRSIKLCHFWNGSKLDAYFKSDKFFPKSKHEFLSRQISINDLVDEFQKIDPSLLHVRFNKLISLPNGIKHYNHENGFTLMPEGTSKALIFRDLPAVIDTVCIYGNGTNDADMFNATIDIPKTLHCVGNNPLLVKLCDVHLENPNMLADYLIEKYL